MPNTAKTDVDMTSLGLRTLTNPDTTQQMFGIVITIPEEHLEFIDGTILDHGETVGFRVRYDAASGAITTPDFRHQIS